MFRGALERKRGDDVKKALVIALFILTIVIVSLLIARCPTGPNRVPGRGVGDLVVFLIVRPG